MVLEVVRSTPPSQHQFDRDPIVTWEALPEDFVLPDDPVENIQQPALAAALTDALGAADQITANMLVGVNFGLVATVQKKLVIKAPDWLLIKNVQPVAAGIIRRSYTPQLQGDAVAIVMEFLSDEDGNELSLRATYPYGKLYFYERILKVPTYVTYDPYENLLEVRQLQSNSRYQLQIPDAEGRFWIPEIQLFIGVWAGERLTQNMNWLRWWHPPGDLLLWPTEKTLLAQQQAEVAQQRSEALAAKLRELGVDPDQI
jgi:Uma2 family endonuclease